MVLHWTGHAFVDAGLAALIAAAKVNSLEAITSEHLTQACNKLQRILLSEQSLGIGVDKSFLSGPMSQLFPNSEFVNPSPWLVNVEGKKKDVRKLSGSSKAISAEWQKVLDDGKEGIITALKEDLQMALRCLQSDGGEEICFVCGERRSSSDIVTVRKANMPLLEGIVNFYPAFAYGVRICGMCALAVRFLPFSVVRTGTTKRLWFLHTQVMEIATSIAKEYGWTYFEDCIAKNKALDFFGTWETSGDAGTVLYLLFTLLDRFGSHLRTLYQTPRPTTAYLFSNDNRGGFVQALPVPHELMVFLAHLQVQSSHAYRRFWHELLRVQQGLTEKERKNREKFVSGIAQRIFRGENILNSCFDHNTPNLQGGWIGHRLYLQEVCGMAKEKLAIIERLGISIAQSEDAKKRVNQLRSAQWNELYSLLLSFVRQGLLGHEEFYALLPPNGYGSASEVRDMVLAVIYEWQHAQERGGVFESLEVGSTLLPDETLVHIQRIGQGLIGKLRNLGRWIARLQTARNPNQIRGAYLNAVQKSAMGFADFVFLAPLDDVQRIWLLRDYLMAFLFDRGREMLIERVEEEVVETI